MGVKEQNSRDEVRDVTHVKLFQIHFCVDSIDDCPQRLISLLSVEKNRERATNEATSWI
jgi:hypothetical protein